MFIIETYTVAVLFCVITMLCWGSWANTQKLAEKTWRFELYYWDYAIGTVLLALIFGLTLGNAGTEGRSFFEDLAQAEFSSLASAFAGGAIFNFANIMIVAAISIAGMAVAFPVGIGLALVLGVLINYIATPYGDPIWLFLGVAMVTGAIVLSALAHRKNAEEKVKIPVDAPPSDLDGKEKVPAKGIILSVAGGVFMSLFYFFVARSMSLDFRSPEPGMMTPYAAVFIFTLGLLASNFIFNTFIMKKPIEGEPVSYKDYFQGTAKAHITGILGGMIWCVGMAFSIIAADMAGFAISYGLGQGATLVAALWGVFIWKEFKNAPKGTNQYITGMFVLFVAGLSLIIYAGI
ncbi:MAG: GRP family sugar transporter [Balneolales bacterium]